MTCSRRNTKPLKTFPLLHIPALKKGIKLNHTYGVCIYLHTFNQLLSKEILTYGSCKQTQRGSTNRVRCLTKSQCLELRRQRKLWELISRRSAGGRGTGFQSSQCCLLFLNGASLTTTWLDWHDKLLRFSPIKNARRQPSVLIKSRWSSEVITGSINRSNYDKTTQSLPGQNSQTHTT